MIGLNSESGKEVLEILQERGIEIDDLEAAAFELYEGGEPSKSEKEGFRQILKKYSEDENVVSLVLSGLLVQEEEIDLEGDPAFLIADELIGINIAEYIGGKKAHFNFMRYDDQKPGVIEDLDVFMDDVVGGMIAGCMTRLFERVNDD